MSLLQHLHAGHRWLIAAVFLIGLAFLCVQPPFEGFDETAHYSSIRQIASTHSIPVYGHSKFAKLVEDYKTYGPYPYTSSVPYDENEGMTYATFFKNKAKHDPYRARYRVAPEPKRGYEPGESSNWQAQHPPLYYLIMASVMTVTDGLSFAAQLFFLRLLSFLFALGGLLIGLYGSARFLGGDARATSFVVLGALLYPFLSPMFFPEFARLGNDSLCLFLFGIAWTGLLATVRGNNPVRAAALLGAALGCGLLTKAFFLPIATGMGAYLLYRVFAARKDADEARRRFIACVIAGGIAVAFGGWWYVYKFITFGSLSGGDEFIRLARCGSVWAMIIGNFSLIEFTRGFASLIGSWYWAGSWSLARIPTLFYLPGLALVGIIFLAYLWRHRKCSLAEIGWAPLWVAAPLLAGFGYYTLVRIGMTGVGSGVAGWYLAIIAPATAFLFAHGLEQAARVKVLRLLFWPLGLATLLFLIGAFWAETSLYAGCAVKTATSKYFTFPPGYCFDRLPEIRANMHVTGWPVGGFLSFIAGLACLLVAAIKLRPWRSG